MSDVISRYMQRSYERKIFVPDPTLSCIKQAVNISYLPITAMSDVISRYMQRSYERKIFVPDPTLSCIKQAVNISYLLLKIWHKNVQNGCDIDFLNATVSSSWFRVS